MKAIIFDVDGVLIDSLELKEQAIIDVLKKHNVYDIKGVKDIFALSLNRKVLLQEIFKLQEFDQIGALDEINKLLASLESKPIPISTTVEFIKKYFKQYSFFINTSIPKESLERVLEGINAKHFFKNTFCGNQGTKLENTIKILDSYSLFPDDVLFIDDTLSHIENVKESGVHTLHFTDHDLNLETYLQNI